MNASILSITGLAATVSIASAAVTIDWVTVGNAGNAADSTGYGSVSYEYQIARNETTIGQYAEFLNAVAKSDPYSLYSTYMASFINGISRGGLSGSYSYTVNAPSANKPITFVNWFDAARFCNWLHNGQGNGSTETGAYTLNGTMSGIVQKNADAQFWIPTEDEWYKAAYYDPTKDGTGGYWLYPTQSNALGGNMIGNPNSANYYDWQNPHSPSQALGVGSYGANSNSYYGTNDQGGNALEWNDAVFYGSSRGLRGGTYLDVGGKLRSSERSGVNPTIQNSDFGFRVASVPEPASVVLTMLFSAALCTRRKR